MKINELLKKIRLENGYTLERMGERLNVTHSLINQIENNKKNVSKKMYQKMLDKFPLYKEEIERAYLKAIVPDNLKNIERSANQLPVSNIDKIEITNFIEIPLYGLASAGNGKINYDEEIEKIVLPKIYGTLSQNDFATRVSGDSMEPYYHHGDIVVIDVDDVDIRALNGKEAVIDLGEERYLKRIIFEEYTGKLILRSFNPAYADIIVSNHDVEEVRCLGAVSMVISMRNGRI